MSYDLLKANTEIKSGLLSLKYREGHYSLKEIHVGSFEVNHRMASGGRYLKDHLVPTSLLWKGLPPTRSGCPCSIQPGLEYLQGWSIYNCFEQSVAVPHRPLSEKFPP